MAYNRRTLAVSSLAFRRVGKVGFPRFNYFICFLLAIPTTSCNPIASSNESQISRDHRLDEKDDERPGTSPVDSQILDAVSVNYKSTERYPAHHDAIANSSVDVIPDGLERAHRIWSRDEAIHRNLSAGERACGLSGDPLDYNTKHDPKVTQKTIDCLVDIKSPRTSWRAFLYSINLSQSSDNSCAALELAGTAMSESPKASVSSFGLMPAKSDNPLLPFAAKYRLLKFPVAVSEFLGANPELAKSFLAEIGKCHSIDRHHTALQKKTIITYFEGISGHD